MSFDGVYEGNFSDGKKDGQGQISWLNGSSYIGEWKNNLFNGKGTYICYSGTKY